MDEARTIDWSTAAVERATLTVELTGEPSREWAEHMDAVLARLVDGARPWGPIKVAKRRIKVESVEAGSVDDLRHLLESAVQQTNADLMAPPEAPEATSSEADETDRTLTETFRAFAPPEG
jgi:hypothetical protein